MDDRTNFFVGWGTLSLINAGLAQSKGRSGLVWCLLSLLLGPVVGSSWRPFQLAALCLRRCRYPPSP